MCGIFGLVGDFRNTNKLLNKISESQKYRGPDQTGFYQNNKKKIFVGTNRLSVIDQENGHQPIISKDKNIVVCFNGVIYNFLKVKKFLEKKNFNFKTLCDTEVILHSYIFWGEKCFQYFDGMWSISIYDKKKNILILSRDYMGQKPLYYNFSEKNFIYSSSLLSILKTGLVNKKIHNASLENFFKYSIVSAPNTLFENVKQLKPGEYLTFDVSKKKIKKKKFWDISKGPNYNIFFNKKKNLNEILIDNFNNFTIADTQPFLLLSSGIDSNLIKEIFIKLKKKFKSISVSFQNKNYDETKNIKRIDKKIFIKNLDYKNILKEIKINMDSVNGDPSFVPSFLLYKSIKNKTKFTIGGDGADELFYGYPTFKAYLIAKLIKFFVPNFLLRFINKKLDLIKLDLKNHINYSFTNKLKFFFTTIHEDVSNLQAVWTGGQLLNKDLSNLFQKNKNFFLENKKIFKNKNLKDNQTYLFKNYLIKLLDKADQASMLNSIEHRNPFLTKELVNYSLKKGENLFNFFEPKKEIVDALKILNPKFLISKKKHGFTFPLRDLLLNKRLVKSIMDEKLIYNKVFFDHKYDEFLKRKRDYSQYLWNEIILNLYLQKIKKI
jgi:asparagine synthase (glutamine-hydrolysing)